MKDCTLVITSCNRDDLLALTLEGLAATIAEPFARVVLTEDGGRSDWQPSLPALQAVSRDVVVIAPLQRVGQIASIDRAYARVETPYIYHCEDDWWHERPGYLEASRDVLDSNPRVSMVWVRHPNDRNGHPAHPALHTAQGGTRYQLMQTSYNRIWHGFSFNPGLRRLTDYMRVGPYTKRVGSRVGHQLHAEAQVSQLYQRLNLRAATLTGGYVHHIGNHRSVTS